MRVDFTKIQSTIDRKREIVNLTVTQMSWTGVVFELSLNSAVMLNVSPLTADFSLAFDN